MTCTPLFILESISKSFPLGDIKIPALQNVSLTISSGEFIAMKGTSGSGKSTLLNILGLIETHETGKLIFQNENISALSEFEKTKRRRSSIGYVFQNFNLLSAITALENVEYPLLLLDRRTSKAVARKKAMEILDLVGVGACAKQKPAQLSGGQRQRVAIARALVKKPSLVLADEPTANLDTKNAEQIIQLLEKLNRELSTTVILATHDSAMAGSARRHIVLRDGSILSDVERQT